MCRSDVMMLVTTRPAFIVKTFFLSLLLLMEIHYGHSFVIEKAAQFQSSYTSSNTCLHYSTTVAFLLPGNPENPLLQESANQIASKLDKNNITSDGGITVCHAVVVVCNTEEADKVCQTANALIALGVESPIDVRFVATAFRLRRSKKSSMSTSEENSSSSTR